MKVVHVCLSCFYIDGFSYQENEIVRQHINEGHDVTVIASTENYKDNQLTYVEPSTYTGNEGAKVIRLAYRKFLPHKIMKKLRLHHSVYKTLEAEAPDVVMFHGLCGWELLTVSKYCANNPNTIFYVDSHEDFNNSARSFISKHVLHKLYYKQIIKACLSKIPKILCISLDTVEFVATFYGVPRDKLEFFPLGGEVFDDITYNTRRESCRETLGIDDNSILFLQSGKFSKRKKLLESLRAFNQLSFSNVKFVLAGIVDDEINTEVTNLINDNDNIEFLGWKDANEIRDLLCAADLYLQPGTQSATMQMSLCARCPVILDDVLSHQPFIDGNGWLINDESELLEAMKSIDFETLKYMSKKSFEIAKKQLDYKELSARVLR